MNKSHWFRIALANFFVAALMGVMMRLAFVIEVPFIQYRYIMHGHSHVAMLGWIYLALYALILEYFPIGASRNTFYTRLFWLTQASVIGMMLSFPIVGYAAASIGFSTAHVVFSIIFAWNINRDLRLQANRGTDSIFLSTSLAFLIISTLAIFAIPIIIFLGLSQSAIYYASIQFFLHFQFNGFYIFVLLAIVFKWLADHGDAVSWDTVKLPYVLFVVSCFLTYVLAVTWSTPLDWLFWVNSLGVVLQLLALATLYIAMKKHFKIISVTMPRWSKALIALAFISFILKITIQGIVVVPTIAVVAYTIRNFVIGFIHLILLGAITSGILGFAIHTKWISSESRTGAFGLAALITGIVLTETILFVQGSMLWAGLGFMPYYYEVIFGVSLIIPLGIGTIWLKSLISSKDQSLLNQP